MNQSLPKTKTSDEIVNGRPIRCYDNDGASLDRYTVIFMDEPYHRVPDGKTFTAYGMNARPFHGIGMHCAAQPGWHLGRRVPMKDLPADCQKLINQHTKP